VTKFMIALKVGMKQYETFIRLESKGFWRQGTTQWDYGLCPSSEIINK
jgi:hypothetical protein